MTVKDILIERGGSACELCGSADGLMVYDIPPYKGDVDKSILLCANCYDQLTGAKPMNPNHWRCLNQSMWSTTPAVQVMAWRILSSLRQEGWPQDLLDMLYLDEETLQWAKESSTENNGDDAMSIIHKDSNGNVLQSGDTVVLIKDLDVKGGGFTAKRGTAVRGISLVEGNAEQIEGRVNGQQIVILTKFVKKS
jgi:protein PhnA